MRCHYYETNPHKGNHTSESTGREGKLRCRLQGKFSFRIGAGGPIHGCTGTLHVNLRAEHCHHGSNACTSKYASPVESIIMSGLSQHEYVLKAQQACGTPGRRRPYPTLSRAAADFRGAAPLAPQVFAQHPAPVNHQAFPNKKCSRPTPKCHKPC